MLSFRSNKAAVADADSVVVSLAAATEEAEDLAEAETEEVTEEVAGVAEAVEAVATWIKLTLQPRKESFAVSKARRSLCDICCILISVKCTIQYAVWI